MIIAENKKAKFNYFIKDTIETGIVLYGSEVKSLRKNRASLNEAYADINNNEVVIYNLHIPEYKLANRFNHDPKRIKKLLLHKREIKKLHGSISKQGMTMIIMKMYFNNKNKIKVLVGIAQGKKEIDKRMTIKEREWNKEKARIMNNTKI